MSENRRREMSENILRLEPYAIRQSPIPGSGSSWAEELDWPTCEAMVTLPAAEPGGTLREDLVDEYEDCCGQPLCKEWGSPSYHCRRYRKKMFRAPSVEALRAKVEEWYSTGVSAIESVLDRREARMRRREQKLPKNAQEKKDE